MAPHGTQGKRQLPPSAKLSSHCPCRSPRTLVAVLAPADGTLRACASRPRSCPGDACSSSARPPAVGARLLPAARVLRGSHARLLHERLAHSVAHHGRVRTRTQLGASGGVLRVPADGRPSSCGARQPFRGGCGEGAGGGMRKRTLHDGGATLPQRGCPRRIACYGARDPPRRQTLTVWAARCDSASQGSVANRPQPTPRKKRDSLAAAAMKHSRCWSLRAARWLLVLFAAAVPRGGVLGRRPHP